jgi:hypothetical protein
LSEPLPSWLMRIRRNKFLKSQQIDRVCVGIDQTMPIETFRMQDKKEPKKSDIVGKERYLIVVKGGKFQMVK